MYWTILSGYLSCQIKQADMDRIPSPSISVYIHPVHFRTVNAFSLHISLLTSHVSWFIQSWLCYLCYKKVIVQPFKAALHSLYIQYVYSGFTCITTCTHTELYVGGHYKSMCWWNCNVVGEQSHNHKGVFETFKLLDYKQSCCFWFVSISNNTF